MVFVHGQLHLEACCHTDHEGLVTEPFNCNAYYKTNGEALYEYFHLLESEVRENEKATKYCRSC